ncbi:MAG TPA: DUF11 domain-containing protein, partial [Dehalococcoidia bacterium]|nr:DUF11 domain-containing protein [Dehalococcoidia bacterium]
GTHSVEVTAPSGYIGTTPNPVDDVYVVAGGTATVNFGFQRRADLSITKTGDKQLVIAGAELTYTITIRNNGPSDATGVVVTDELPDGVTLVSADGGILSNGTITWNIGDLASDGEITLTVVVTINQEITQVSVENIAAIGGSEYDPDPESNTATEETPVVDYIKISSYLDIDNITAGESLAYTAEAYDAYNTSLGDVTSDTFFSINTAAGGNWSPHNTYNSENAGRWTVTGDYYGEEADATLFVKSGPLDHFIFATIPNPQAAGVPFSITITAVDACNNTVTDYTDTADLSDDTGTVKAVSTDGPVTGNFISGVWTGNVIITATSTDDTITATDDSITGESNEFDVEPGPHDHFIFATIPSPQVAGVPFSITITAVDACNNTVTDYTGRADLGDDTGTIMPVETGDFTAGVWTGDVTITTAGTDNTIEATDGAINGESNEFDVEPGPLHHFIFATIPSPQVAGIPFSITITAVDVYGNTITDYTGRADLSDDTGTITPVETGDFTAGVWTGDVTITTAGTDNTIEAIDGIITGESNEFNVSSGETVRLELRHVGSDSNTVGTEHTLIVTAYDDEDNPVLNEVITWAIVSGPGDFVSRQMITNESGEADAVITSTLVGDTVVKASVSETVYATATKTWTADELDHFNFSAIFSPQVAGVPFTITITAVDEYNNTVTDYTGRADLSDGTGTIAPVETGDFTLGVWTGEVTIHTTGTDNTITATGDTITGESNEFDIEPGPTVSGFVFNDTDRNGVYDAGEIGIGGVTIELFRGETVLRTTLTAGDGSYSFLNVTPGNYRVVETNLPGYNSTTPDEVPITVVLGEDEEVDFGDVLSGPEDPAVIYGTVFNDANGNGVQDDGELGIPDVNVTLDDITPTTTDEFGRYTFSVDSAGVHTVVETDPDGYFSTTPNGVHVDITLGDSYQVDFGDAIIKSVFAVIYGTVFDDANGNREQDDGELGIPDVTVTLDDTTSTTTDEFGRYMFRVDIAGVHTVVETDPDGHFSTTPNEVHVDVTLGEDYQVDFGDAARESEFASIYGTVFNDTNGNTDWDDDELGIPGVTVTLRVESTAINATTTDGFGRYMFKVEVPGVYTVEETDLAGYTSTTSNEADFEVALGNDYVANFGDRIPPPIRRLGYIVISPETISIYAGESQTYTARAYDTTGASMGDVTSFTAFSIQVGAGGNWSGNTYTSENIGQWRVTGTYLDKSDTAILNVAAEPVNGGDDEEPDEEEPDYFTVNFLGEITRVPMADTGELLATMEAPSPDGRHLLEIQQGTIVADSEGRVVTLIEITEAENPGLPDNTTLLGKAYDFRPSGTEFSIRASVTLGYELDELPENVVSVALACYTDEFGWTEFASRGGVVAELGKETADVEHFTIFAVLARVSTHTPPGSDQEFADFLLDNLIITPLRSEIWEFLTFVVTTGEDATITVEVTNIGGEGGTYTAFLKLDGIIIATQKVSLEPGQTETITFDVGPNDPGTYQVEIGGLSGEFESSVWINWGLVLGLPAGLILLALLLWYLRKRRQAQAV